MAANTKAIRNLLKDEDAKALGAWFKYRVKDLGVTMRDFANMTGISYSGVLARVGTMNKGNGRTVPVCLSVDEVKIVAKELGIPALYIFVAFNYPGYSIKTHVKDTDVKTIEAISKIRNEANHLLRPLGYEKEPRKQRPSIKDNPFYGFAKTLDADSEEEEETVDEEPKIEFIDDEDSETIYVPIHIGAFRKQLREKFTKDVTVKVAFNIDHVTIDISYKKLGIDKRYEMAPWDIEGFDAAMTISALFQKDVMDIFFKKENESVG